MFNPEDLYKAPPKTETRWASAENWDAGKGEAAKELDGRKGSPSFPFKAGEVKTLAHTDNTSGTIRRIWITINERTPKMLRGIRIDMYWDGEDTPAVSAPLGDFFNQGLGRCSTFQSALFSNPEGRSFNCTVPMPFKTGMRITATNESGDDLAMFFYDVDFTVNDNHGDNVLYFHAHWRRENPTTFKQDYEFLPKITGKGRFLGVNCSVIADTDTYFNSWWGEGECKVYLDGDTDNPTLCGTGTEDYIGTAWGQGQYAHMYQGCQLADHENMQFNFYRFHIPDPVYFHKEIRVTMHQIGCWGPNNIGKMREAGLKLQGIDGNPVDLDKAVKDNGYGLFERQDDWSSCAYFYLDSPANDLPEIPPSEERIKGCLAPEDANKRIDT